MVQYDFFTYAIIKLFYYTNMNVKLEIIINSNFSCFTV